MLPSSRDANVFEEGVKKGELEEKGNYHSINNTN